MTKDMVSLSCPTSLNPLLLQLQHHPQDLLLWQNVAEGPRTSHFARLGRIDLAREEMTFFPKVGEEFGFHGRSYLYSYAKGRTTIFKSTILYHSRIKLVIRLPRLVMVANIRNAVRQVTPDRYVHYSHSNRSHPDLLQLYLNSKLLDLSPTGLAFKSSITNVVKFAKGERIWMRSPFGDNGAFDGVVKHVTPVRGERTEEYLRIGVSFLGRAD